MSNFDNVTKPKHYQGKYGIEDLKKAKEHLDWLIELEEKDSEI